MLYASITRSLGRALEASPRARELCAQLAGRRLKLEIRGWPVPLIVTASADALHVASESGAAGAAAAATAQADVTVSSGPLGLLALATGNAEAAVADGAVTVDGDEAVARRFQELGRLLRPDLEALLARVMGRIPAHLAARAAASLGAWSRGARESLLRNAADYLAHESRDLVPRAEAEGFLGGVEALRTRLANAEARAARLAAELAAFAGRGAPRGRT